MARTLVDIPQDKLSALDFMVTRLNVSRAALIRDAINEYIAKHSEKPNIKKAFGILKEKPLSALQLQQQLREEWE